MTIFCPTTVGHCEANQLELHCNQYWVYIPIDPAQAGGKGVRLYTKGQSAEGLGMALLTANEDALCDVAP